MRRTIHETERQVAQSPCRHCPLLSEHSAARAEVRELERSLRDAEEVARSRQHEYRDQLRAYRSVLETLGHLQGDHPTRLGLLAASVYGENTLLVAQAVAEGWLSGLAPAEICAVLVMLAADDRNSGRPGPRRRMPTKRVDQLARRLQQAQRELRRLEDEWGISESRPPSVDYVEYVYNWSRGVPLTDLQPPSGVDSGDALRATKSCYALVRQLEQGLAGWDLLDSVRLARESLERDLIRRL